ncbi:ABC transporter substrate-binding protein [Phreatobacter stygius]|uniref:ABC transporter substrate-binding protein n=1 Tax=Phreatobacter stygius TaxID=1940610 RepID=A0A4D7AY27_9HYPH|nr:ABC transporter substrate-binding protein [Phreatobacter stygius]QCI66434.1 ABC transporter substrate-binding protein [Phreatobacter stygius]
MKRVLSTLAAGLAFALAATASQAQEPIRIGVIETLSGPSAVLGQHARDGFQLAIRQLGGKMGGREVQVIVVDDEQKPDVAIQRVQGLIDRDKVDFVVGPIFSNVLQAIQAPVVNSRAFLISANAGPSSYAGKACHENMFVTSYQNDQVHEVLGAYAQARNMRRVFLLAPNYQAGRDAMAGFKRHFRGEIVDEAFTPLGHLDFAAELARIGSSRPDGLFTFMPGGMGVNLVRQYRQAGLVDRTPFLSAFTVDESTLPAQQDSAIGMIGGMTWAPNMDNPQNKKFVADFEAAFGYVPGSYAMQAYDSAMLIDSAVRAVNGNLTNRDAVRTALRKADFVSLRGNFRFANNHYPIQDFYTVRAAKRPDGKFQTEIVERVFTNYTDVYAQDCPMRW